MSILPHEKKSGVMKAGSEVEASTSSLPVISPPRLEENSSVDSRQKINDLAADALTWATLHGLLVGDRRIKVRFQPDLHLLSDRNPGLIR